ncbi:MAG: HAMP domain-containing protein [Thioalkalivibrionaceae bacterium]
MSGRSRPQSLRRRIALIFGGFSGILLVLFGLVLDRAIVQHFLGLDRAELDAHFEALDRLLTHDAALPGVPAAAQRVNTVLGAQPQLVLRILDHEGAILFGLRDAAFDQAPERIRRPIGANPSDRQSAPHDDAHGAETGARAARHDPVARGGGTSTLAHWRSDGATYVGQRRDLPPTAGPAATAMLALDTGHHEHFLARTRIALGVAVLIATLAAFWLGAAVARCGLAPMTTITHAARRLSVERLDQRLTIVDAPEELADLVTAYNGMLDRLESAFARLRDFSGDIAHELRTPISNLMTET